MNFIKKRLDNKSLILLIALIISIIFFVILFYLLCISFINKLSFEKFALDIYDKNNRQIFTIDKIVLFSSCNSDSSINTNSTININNLTQYTDIAIFINNSSNEHDLSNTLNSVSIKNFSFSNTPKLGSYNIYYKSLTNFAKYSLEEENLIDNELDFKILSSDETDYSTPVLFNNCANPITLSYINSNITNDYTISNDNSISYDGSLLKKCNILLDDISCSFSFTIFIENNLGEKFKCPVYINIPLKNDSNSIYDGSFTYTYNPDFVFYRYE